MSDVVLLDPRELTDRDWSAWDEFRNSQSAYASPFFATEFTRAVAESRPGVRIARLGSARAPEGFVPFEANRLGVGRPVGGRFNDECGPILAPGVRVDPRWLVRQMGLISWDYFGLPAAITGFPLTGPTLASRYLDLTRGFDAYCAERKAAGSDIGDDLLKPNRRIERNLGRLRFEWHTADPSVLATLFTWKRAQYAATGFTDVLAVDWPRKMLTRLATTETAGLRGVLSALWIADESGGERLAAVHLGLASGSILHSWFPAYDGSLSKYAPGFGLLGRIAREAGEHGITQIRLGLGDDHFKVRLASGVEWQRKGHVDAEPGVTALRDGWTGAKQWLRSKLTSGRGASWWAAAHHLKERWALQ